MGRDDSGEWRIMTESPPPLDALAKVAICPLCGFSRPKERATCEPCDDAARAVATAWFASIWTAGA